ncbi:MAG: hypothetical protein NVSMB46_00360 [Candidatus Saccharimonadales bacterium]
MSPVTKQEILNLLDTTKNRICERMATHQDMQILQDSVKNMYTINQQNTQLLRQSEYQRTQLVRRSVALESRLVTLEQELRGIKQMLSRFLDHQPQHIVIPAQPDTSVPPANPSMQYIY